MHESEKWKWSCSVMSNSQRPHGLQPTRLLRPWDFLAKNTGVGCHCLLQFQRHYTIYQFFTMRMKITWVCSYKADCKSVHLRWGLRLCIYSKCGHPRTKEQIKPRRILECRGKKTRPFSPCLFNLYAEYIMRNAGLEEAQAGIKIARRNINNLRICRWHHPYGRKWRTKEPFDESERGEWKSWLKTQHAEN